MASTAATETSAHGRRVLRRCTNQVDRIDDPTEGENDK